MSAAKTATKVISKMDRPLKWIMRTWLLLLLVVFFTGCNGNPSKKVSDKSGDEKSNSDSSTFEPIDPVLEMKINSPHDDPTVKNAGEPDPRGDSIRKNSFKVLESGEFSFAGTLPTLGHRAHVPGKLRPVREVALRLMALNALFTWVTAPEDAVPTNTLSSYIKNNRLRSYLAEDEVAILDLSRGEAGRLHGNTIGWRLENMWALAWILGFEHPPEPMTGQIANKVSRAMIFEFLPGFDTSVEDLLKKAKPRTEDEVIKLEDVFYCAHNSVRSAQTGSTTSVPKDFHPVRDGGAIHERRHALTWAISPDVDWDDTDLST